MTINRLEKFFNNLKKSDNEQSFNNICEIEREYIRNYYSTTQSMKWGFSKYRNYLKNEYYKDDEILQKCINEIDILKNEINSDNSIEEAIIITAIKYNLSLIILKKQYDDYLKILSYLRIRDLETKQIKEEYNNKVRVRRTDLQYILDVVGYIEKAIELLNEKTFILKVLGLAALTGRRVAEIGCTANFGYINEFMVSFNGQLKTKKIDNEIIIDIPVLANADLIITAMIDLRGFFRQYVDNPIKFHDNCSTYLNKKVDIFKPYIEGDLSPKDLRAIYACIAYNKYCFNDRMDDTAYYSYILGHDEKDNATSLSYTKYKIK